MSMRVLRASVRFCIVFLVCLLVCLLSTLSVPSQAQTALVAMERPFLFAYGTWDKRAKIENGVALLNVEGMTPKGGAGANLTLDLGGKTDTSPGLRVQVGPRNTLKTLKLMLNDTQGHSGTWYFTIPASGNLASVASVVIPVDGAPFSRPNEVGKTGMPDLGKIMQWQLMGDWGGDGPVDLRIEAILALPADATLLKAREGLAKKEAEARLQAERERIAARERYGKRTADSPEIQRVYAAAPDILALEIHTGKITPAKLSDYKPLPGDVKNDNGGKDRPHLVRDGKDLGMLVGPVGKESGLVTFEGFSGDPLLLAEADDVANYLVRSPDDPNYASGVAPRRVMRKSKADDWQQPIQGGVAVLHHIYLSLPQALKPGKTYTVSLGHLNTQQPTTSLKFEPTKVWSESIHVNQVGFRPDDPLKRAYLSLWRGNGGGHAFPARQAFHLIDVKTEKSVYSGTVGTAWPADRPEKMHSTRNFNGTDVAPIDFSDFKTPGQYRVEVEGIGVSFPFEIGPNVWERAFWVQMKGFYNQRSGVALGPPYTDFVRPICFKPGVNDCLPITQSSYNILDDQPGGLPKYDTGKPVPEAWGGYHDAGDWNPRRMDHMSTTTFWQLELLQLFPDYFASLKLNIPNDAPGPDLLKECLFELALFHRLQLPDGSCRYGIETDGDPNGGEVSWKQHMPAFVYGPDAYSSYLFAAVAARASQVLEAYDKSLAKTYRQDAVRAMQWAEADRAKRIANGTWNRLERWNLPGERNRAAICLYAATHDAHWHTVFLEDTPLKGTSLKSTETVPFHFYGNTKGRDAAFTYARLPEGLGDPEIRKRARQALIADADGSLEYQQNNAFGIASDDPGKPQFLGFYSNPHGAVSMVRAYTLTHDLKYRRGALQACLFPAGANPDNLVYTSGLGSNPIRPLNLDSLATGQKPPIGITPYGIVDLSRWSDNWIVWPLNYFLGKHTQPAALDWPTTESFFNVRFMPALDEFTMDQTMGPNAYVWGYLAAQH